MTSWGGHPWWSRFQHVKCPLLNWLIDQHGLTVILGYSVILHLQMVHDICLLAPADWSKTANQNQLPGLATVFCTSFRYLACLKDTKRASGMTAEARFTLQQSYHLKCSSLLLIQGSLLSGPLLKITSATSGIYEMNREKKLGQITKKHLESLKILAPWRYNVFISLLSPWIIYVWSLFFTVVILCIFETCLFSVPTPVISIRPPDPKTFSVQNTTGSVCSINVQSDAVVYACTGGSVFRQPFLVRFSISQFMYLLC